MKMLPVDWNIIVPEYSLLNVDHFIYFLSHRMKNNKINFVSILKIKNFYQVLIYKKRDIIIMI